MAKIPEDPKEIFQEIVDDYRDIFKDDLISVILYGSAAGQDYRPGTSDINFMIVLSEEGIDNLDLAFKVVTRWRKRNVAVPLFLTRGYIETSTDTFPIEYLNFQRNHLLVYGDDILQALSFGHDFIRLQCEREIKGKLLLLREAYLESNAKGRILKGIIHESLQAFLAIFAALLFLQGKEIPDKKRAIIEDTCGYFDMDKALFHRLLDIKEQNIKPGDHELREIFKRYLAEIRSLAKKVDALGG